MNVLKMFWKGDEGQDLIEYTLLLAFVCLVAAGVFINAGTTTSGIWSIGNSRLSAASASAS